MATLQIFDAAHYYGFDNMSVTPAQADANALNLGTLIRTVTSYTDAFPPVGQPATIVSDYSNGFSAVTGFTVVNDSQVVVNSGSIIRTATNELLTQTTTEVVFDKPNFYNDVARLNYYVGDDSIIGNNYNNALKGFQGNNFIDGGNGTDTAFYSDLASQYRINRDGTNLTVSSQAGVDHLVNVERLAFADVAVAFDVNGNAGEAYRIYQAAFDRTPDTPGLSYWINVLDHGASLDAVAGGFVASAEFRNLYGSNPSTAQIVDRLYENVLHRAGEPGGVAYWNNELNSGHQTRAMVLADFSESPENQAQVIGSIQDGIAFTPILS